MTALTGSSSPRVGRVLARATALMAAIALVGSLIVTVMTGAVEVTLFTIFAAVGGAYAAQVGWRDK